MEEIGNHTTVYVYEKVRQDFFRVSLNNIQLSPDTRVSGAQGYTVTITKFTGNTK